MNGRQPRAWVRVSHRTKDLHPSKERWEVAYEDPDAELQAPYQGSIHHESAADKWADDFRDSTRNGTYVDPERGKHTLATVAGEYLDTTHFPKARTATGDYSSRTPHRPRSRRRSDPSRTVRSAMSRCGGG